MVDLDSVPASLREHLGLEATGGLVQLFNRAQSEWSAEVLSVAAERFDRRLVEETSKLRVEMAHGFAALREEIAEQKSELRQDITQGLASVRQEMAEDLASVRQEMAQGRASVRQDMASQRADLIKWAFLFWIGQVGATAALLAFMLRGLR